MGDAVRADLTALDSTRVKKAGDTMTGTLNGTHLAMSGNIVAATGDIICGKSGLNETAVGVEVHDDGRLYVCTTTAGIANIRLLKIAGATGDGSQFIRFGYSQGSNTAIGSITEVGTTGVAYNTTSDKRLKTLTRPVDPDEAVAKVAALEPVNFTFTSDPAAGEQVGFFAQDLQPVAPEVVTVGTGEPDDEGFTPWMVDVSKLVPTLVAAVQALTARIEELAGPVSYSAQAQLSGDPDFVSRVSASAAVEVPPPEHPVTWAREHIWRVAAAPGFADAYESALAGNVSRPGNDPAVISDAQILSAVQAEIGVS